MTRWIPVEDEASALRELLLVHRNLAMSVFEGRLRPAQLAYTDDASLLGRWRPERRTIELNRNFVCSAPWLETVEVLKHEMAHQLVSEAYHAEHEPPHGPTFQRVCAHFGIDGRASGSPQPAPETSSAMRRVEKLLSLGQSSERHEAEAAMSKARALQQRYNLQRLQAKQPSAYGFRQVGVPTRRSDAAQAWVGHILIRHFFVEAIWVPAFVPGGKKSRGSVLELLGTPENLEIAAYVHDFLHGTADRLWHAHKASSGVSGHGRRRYRAGVMMGFSEKLDGSQLQVSNPDERALLVSGDPGLHAYKGRRYPRVRTTRRGGTRDDEVMAAGKAAGRDIVLRRGVADDGGSSGRSLPARTR